MRIDIVTIFPEFFATLDVSLLGKARQSGLIQTHVHDLRDVTTDKHRTVDDTPYGGGAGMVMKPEPWGVVLDEIFENSADPLVIFPSPAGEVFTQKMARELSTQEHLVFGCGRYEGIDHRVFDYANSKAKLRLVSLGDYAGQPLERIEKDTDRDNFLSAAEAAEYGLIDKVLTRRDAA